MKANQISNENLENKTALYMALASENFEKAKEVFNSKKSYIMQMFLNDMQTHLEKCKKADCEYAAYINAHATDIYLEKMKNFAKN